MFDRFASQGLGLVILMGVNIAMGSVGSLFVKKFDGRKFWHGIVKSGVVLACFLATYFAGFLNPDILAISVGETDYNVMTALDLVVLAGYYHYAKQVLEKFAVMIGVNFDDKSTSNPPDEV